jgi:hypothetical protein
VLTLISVSGWTGTLEKYRQELAGSRLIDRHSRLIPEDDLLSLQQAIQARLRPASAVQVARVVGAIIGSFKIGDVLGDPAAYTNAMTSELAAYPADVLNEAVRRARRTLKWLPAIAEMVEICGELIAESRRQLCIADRMLEEHGRRRRQIEARRCRLEDKAARIAAVYGDAVAVSADELDLAQSLRHWSLGKFCTLSESLDRGEPWAATFIRRSALAELARRAEKAARIGPGRAAAITGLIMVDEPAARRQLANEIGKDSSLFHEFAIPIDDDVVNFDSVQNQADFDAAVAQIAAAAWEEAGAGTRALGS